MAASRSPTAGVSVLTAVLLWRILPDALALPSRGQLETPIEPWRSRSTSACGPRTVSVELNRELEQRVSERTADSRPTNGRLRAALAEKEVLLREVQHRVKNNLQVVSSLISLQARKVPPALKPYFQESLERVGAIGRVHEQLIARGFGSFDAAELFKTICGDLAQIYGADRDRITCRVEAAQAVPLPLDAATPLALIVNEVVSNAFKHAFGDGRRGEILVTLGRTRERSAGDHDDGIGFIPGTPLPWTAVDGLAADPQLLAGQIGGRTQLVDRRWHEVFADRCPAPETGRQSDAQQRRGAGIHDCAGVEPVTRDRGRECSPDWPKRSTPSGADSWPQHRAQPRQVAGVAVEDGDQPGARRERRQERSRCACSRIGRERPVRTPVRVQPIGRGHDAAARHPGCPRQPGPGLQRLRHDGAAADDRELGARAGSAPASSRPR